MLEALFGKSVIPLSELLWRFGLAALFGFLVGLDREMRGISAGVRTHMLVALSSAMTMLIALELFEELTARGDADPDPTRAIQGLAQAIGFLCAGVIFVARGSVYGLTTAASLWMTSSIGMAALGEITAHPQAKADRSQELAEVGTRLEVARQQETQAREDLARLAQENAVKTADVARAEQRIQRAREAEAALQQHLVAARGQMEDMAQQRGQSEQALAALASNRDTLAPEIEKLEQQRAQVQQALAKLTDDMAALNRELADVNGRLQSAQQELADLQSKLADILQQLGSSPLPAQQPGPSSADRYRHFSLMG